MMVMITLIANSFGTGIAGGLLLRRPLNMFRPIRISAGAVASFGIISATGVNSSITDGLPVLMMVMITLIANSFGTGIAGGLLFYIVIKGR
jgi:AGZA family xanthine/uracil permease-like MFS transporter